MSLFNVWSVFSQYLKKTMKSYKSFKVIQWNFVGFKDQSRLLQMKHSFSSHARGVFVSKSLQVFAIYEPRLFDHKSSQWFDAGLNKFASYYASYKTIVIYDDQTSTHDCELRVLRFGYCCWSRLIQNADILNVLLPHKCPCGLKITAVSKYYIRKTSIVIITLVPTTVATQFATAI